MPLLKTVRAKLTTLVGLSAVTTLLALPILHRVMTDELLDVVDDRVPESVRGFDLELADDLRDMQAATLSLADSDELEQAITARSTAQALGELNVFHEAYPGIALVAYSADGTPFASVGLSGAAPHGSAARALIHELTDGEVEARQIVHTGCADQPQPESAYVIVRRVRKAGVLVSCMLIDERYLANSHAKLGVELALLPPGARGASLATSKFPVAALQGWNGKEGLVELDRRAWALTRFTPEPVRALAGRFDVVVALDMTRVRDVVRHNLGLTLAVLLAAALLALIVGARLARVMSQALGRLSAALKRLEQDEYVHVTGVKTGDEIEDLATGFNSMVDGLRERDKLRSTFGKYMTESVLEHLLKGKVELGGEALTVTILFTDIRGFTTISEAMPAQELVQLLNEYFTDMVSIVIKEGGVVDKYIGDAIMAVFGAPVSKADDTLRAVRAAKRMRGALQTLNARLAARGKPTLRTGIGLHRGEVVAGNIGSEQRMEYTVIGDAVNLAARLETATKELGVDVLVSEDVREQVHAEIETRFVAEISVKGRAKPVRVYEVVSDARSSSPPRSQRSSKDEAFSE